MFGLLICYQPTLAKPNNWSCPWILASIWMAITCWRANRIFAKPSYRQQQLRAECRRAKRLTKNWRVPCTFLR
uniref:Uncharacterized protein n=1 Tax=Arundo donax TaxID=35708 RepID=A0A0A9BL27_ARUDO